MRSMYSMALVAAGLVMVSGAVSADQLPTLSIEAFRTGVAPAGLEGIERPSGPTTEGKASSREKSSALNGTLYSVIAPTYDGTGTGTLSFIRLFNGAQQTSTFSVTVVGSPSGRTYGSANIAVPRSASLQEDLGRILARASAGPLTGGDTGYALYVQNADTASGWQHVTYNDGNKFFENHSVCGTLLNQQIASISSTQVLINVHTSRLSAYPSRIQIHNYWNAAVTYRVTIIDAVTGAVINAFNVATAANASYDIPMSQVESQINFVPTAAQNHVNVFVTDPSGAPPYEVLGHTIMNSALGASLNLSTACAVNALSSSPSSSGGPGLNGY
jgi:hypothetical protein